MILPVINIFYIFHVIRAVAQGGEERGDDFFPFPVQSVVKGKHWVPHTLTEAKLCHLFSVGPRDDDFPLLLALVDYVLERNVINVMIQISLRPILRSASFSRSGEMGEKWHSFEKGEEFSLG